MVSSGPRPGPAHTRAPSQGPASQPRPGVMSLTTIDTHSSPASHNNIKLCAGKERKWTDAAAAYNWLLPAWLNIQSPQHQSNTGTIVKCCRTDDKTIFNRFQITPFLLLCSAPPSCCWWRLCYFICNFLARLCGQWCTCLWNENLVLKIAQRWWYMVYLHFLRDNPKTMLLKWLSLALKS